MSNGKNSERLSSISGKVVDYAVYYSEISKSKRIVLTVMVAEDEVKLRESFKYDENAIVNMEQILRSYYSKDWNVCVKYSKVYVDGVFDDNLIVSVLPLQSDTHQIADFKWDKDDLHR